jgi:hypothetical protein
MKLLGTSSEGCRLLFVLFVMLGVLSTFDFILHGCLWERGDLLVLPTFSIIGLLFCLFSRILVPFKKDRQ